MECSVCICENPLGSFKVNVSLLRFCQHDLATDEKGVLKSPIIIILLCISPFGSVNIYLNI